MEQPTIRNATYELYNTELSGPLIFVLQVYFLDPGEMKEKEGKKGLFVSGNPHDFPVLFETNRAKIMFILNGGIGFFNEVNPFYSKGAEFTAGNPVANNPGGKGVRFWGESYLEPGMAAITQLGNSKLFAYGAATILASGRNTSDIYSEGPAGFIDWERAYLGILGAGLGKAKQTNFDISIGRQFFQLNDGFLISKFSGSANAGPRGSVYLNSRTAFEKSILFKLHQGGFSLNGFWIEPQELFDDKQTNTNYAGLGLNYKTNQRWDIGINYIQTTGSHSSYNTSHALIPKEGMYIVNPKIWLSKIANSAFFFKSEYAYQSHLTANMNSSAWYIGLGISKDDWRYRPTLYYRYASMSGDDSSSKSFERFDPILTGGLGNWVQGINNRKLIGNGNLLSHRIEFKMYPSKKIELALDYFLLYAQSNSNIGGLAPISNLKSRYYSQEITFTSRFFITKNFMFLTILSYAKPGDAFIQAFDSPIYDWTSVQMALFMFF